MKLGDLVQYQDQPWVVRRCVPPTAILLDAGGHNIEIPCEDPACQVIANPSTEWPFLIVRDNPRGGVLKGLTRVVSVRSRVTLERFHEWVPSDPARSGGSIFINPTVRLFPAEVLLVHWSNGPDTSVKVPVHFATVTQRVARQQLKRPPEVTVFDHLLVDRFDEDA